MVDVAFGPEQGQRPNLADTREAYLDMVRRKRMYGGILLLLFVVLMASGWRLAEERNSGQITRVVRFLAATYNGQAFPLDLFELRAVDVAISDDMLRCLDALRWGRADLHTLVPDRDRRMQAVIARWGLRWPEGS